jgi:hypothetical protein
MVPTRPDREKISKRAARSKSKRITYDLLYALGGCEEGLERLKRRLPVDCEPHAIAWELVFHGADLVWLLTTIDDLPGYSQLLETIDKARDEFHIKALDALRASRVCEDRKLLHDLRARVRANLKEFGS